ncbi:MAG: hypothetical protein ACTHLR_15500, partial [Rhizomicrobium sp.]
IAPIGLAVLAALVTAIPHPMVLLFTLPFAAITSAIVSLLAVLVFGVPTYLICRKSDHPSIWPYMIVGVIISVLAAGLLVTDEMLGLKENSAQILFERTIQAVVLFSGPLAAWAFWRKIRPG